MKKPVIVLIVVAALVLLLIISGVVYIAAGDQIMDLFNKDEDKDDNKNTTNNGDNTPPIARIVVRDASGNESYDRTFDLGEAVIFDANSSSGSIVRFKWNFGDGSPEDDGSKADNERINHTYTEKGRYTVTLMVTDINGAKAWANVSISILGIPYVDSQMYILSSFGVISPNQTCNIPIAKDALNMTVNITATGLSKEGAGTLVVEITDSFDNLMANKTMTVLIQDATTFYFEASEISVIGTYFVKLNCEKGTMQVVVDINVKY